MYAQLMILKTHFHFHSFYAFTLEIDKKCITKLDKSDFKSLYFNNVGAIKNNFVKKYHLSSRLREIPISIKVFQKIIVTEIVEY